MKPSFWSGRRVLLTGHTGFKGAWLALWLTELGAEVTGYSLAPPTTPSLFDQARVAERLVASLEGDVRDLSNLRSTLTVARPEVVVHLAAQSLVRRSYSDPVETYTTNVVGTINVLEAVRQQRGVGAVLIATSDKCYENRNWVWPYRESDPLGGHDPYSSSKACAELIISAYARSFFSDEKVALLSARAGNVIGGGDWAVDRLVPDAIRAFERGEPVRLRNPSAVRPWQDVLDALGGYLTLVERAFARPADYTGAWNFGPPEQDGLTVASVAETLGACWGRTPAWVLDEMPAPHEAQLLRLDTAKARTLLGWSPRFTSATAVKMCAEWYRAVREGQSASELARSRIRQYAGIAS